MRSSRPFRGVKNCEPPEGGGISLSILLYQWNLVNHEGNNKSVPEATMTRRKKRRVSRRVRRSQEINGYFLAISANSSDMHCNLQEYEARGEKYSETLESQVHYPDVSIAAVER